MTLANDLATAILDKGLARLRELEARRHELDKDILVLRYEVQRNCPHPKEQIVACYPPYGLDAYRVCRLCGFAHVHNLYCRGPLSDASEREVPSVEVEEAEELVRGVVLTEEALRLQLRKTAVPCVGSPDATCA